jgi:hypothetical protein
MKIWVNRPVIGAPNKKVNHFILWWDNEGVISDVAVTDYTEVAEEFRKNRHIILLGGMWKGATITGSDIQKVREELSKTLEERWCQPSLLYTLRDILHKD